MKDNLKEIFDTEREWLPQEAMPEGHELRFIKKLESQKQKKVYHLPLLKWGLAASVLVAAFWLGKISMMQPQENVLPKAAASMALNEVSTEMAEVEQYLSGQVDNGIQQMQAFKKPNALTNDVLASTEEQLKYLEEEYNKLMLELAVQPGNERIIHAMIQNYRLRLMLIERTLSTLENTKQTP
jgi:hypothetical protein